MPEVLRTKIVEKYQVTGHKSNPRDFDVLLSTACKIIKKFKPLDMNGKENKNKNKWKNLNAVWMMDKQS